MKQLKLTYAGESYYAKLLTDKAPKACAAIESICPFQSKMQHAKICDNEMFFQAPVNIDEEENPTYSCPGHVSFFNFRQTVCIWYDKMVPLGFCNQFAEMDEVTLKRFAEMARKLWEKEGGLILVEVVDK